jgi:hypothetical protein
MTRYTLKNCVSASLTEARRLLNGFRIFAATTGELRIQPAGPILSYEGLELLVRRLATEQVDRQATEMVFDFGMIERIEAPWTPALALLIQFARHAAAPCRLVGLHGQPRAVVGLFAGSGPVRLLLGLDRKSGLDQEDTRWRASA